MTTVHVAVDALSVESIHCSCRSISCEATSWYDSSASLWYLSIRGVVSMKSRRSVASFSSSQVML